MGDRHVQQHPDVAVAEPVKHDAARAAGFHDAMRAHEPKGLAHRGFALAAYRCEVMHADLAGLEQGGEDPDPAGVAHQPEHSGDPFNVLRRGQRRLEKLNSCAVAPWVRRVVRFGNALKLSVHLNILADVYVFHILPANCDESSQSCTVFECCPSRSRLGTTRIVSRHDTLLGRSPANIKECNDN